MLFNISLNNATARQIPLLRQQIMAQAEKIAYRWRWFSYYSDHIESQFWRSFSVKSRWTLILYQHNTA